MTELVTLETALGLAVLILLSLLVLVVRMLIRARRDQQPRVKARPPMDRARRGFYRTLRRALPRQVILAQVPYGRFLVPSGLSAARGRELQASLDGYLADFLICNENLSCVAVIALDDSADNAQEDLLQEAGLPLIRWQGQALPEISEVRTALQPLLTRRPAVSSPDARPAGGDDADRSEPTLGNLPGLDSTPQPATEEQQPRRKEPTL